MAATDSRGGPRKTYPLGHHGRVQEHVGPGLRLTRAAVVAGVAFLLGLGAHVAADGGTPGVLGLTGLYVVMVLGTALTLGRPAGTGRLIALVAGGQFLLHTALTAVGGHGGDDVGRATASAPIDTAGQRFLDLSTLPRDGSLSDAYAAAQDRLWQGQSTAGLTLPDWLGHLLGHVVADLTGPNLLMALAHVAAAAGAAWWLARGEQALWTLLRLAGHWWAGSRLACALLLVLVLPPAPVRVPGAAAYRLVSAPITEVLRHTQVRRGPPEFSLAA